MLLPERRAGARRIGVAVEQEAIEEQARVGAERDVGVDVAAEVLRD